ncbi:hypothetical protein Vi05172_g845 [Venturia inaequalis]|nr:hypothetical protein Vi05172_g845 [Venturia inaequalis]
MHLPSIYTKLPHEAINVFPGSSGHSLVRAVDDNLHYRVIRAFWSKHHVLRRSAPGAAFGYADA